MRNSRSIESLRGLTGVGIFVDDGGLPRDDPGELEIFRKEAHQEIEWMLVKAGVPVSLCFEDIVLTPGQAVLGFAMNFVAGEEVGFVALTIFSSLSQTVRIERTDAIGHAVTWWQTSTRLVKPTGFWTAVTQDLRQQVTTFIQAYKEAQ